ncbi:hypothetical protein, partial [Burkholderia pseudomallei]
MPARERRAVSGIRHCRRAGRHASANRRARAAPVARGIDRDKKRQPGLPQIADKPSPSAGFLFFNGVMLKTPMPTQHEL